MNKRFATILFPLCTMSFGMAFDSRAENVGYAHIPNPEARFLDALSPEDLAVEMSLNAVADGPIAKSVAVRKLEAVPKANVNIFGSIRNNLGAPVCGLVLANGQFMFSCAPTGSFSLDAPADAANQITLFGFADGHFPFKAILNGSGGRYDITINVASSVTPPPPPTPTQTTSTIQFEITDNCNNGVQIQYKFFDETYNLVWPSSTTHYTTQFYGASYTHALQCNTDARVCYGARSGTYYWGVDVDDTKSCTDCCIFCTPGNSLSRRLTC